jgi:hypothetical protein
MPTSKDLKDLDSQLKKTVISAESFKRGSSFDLSKNLGSIHKNIGSLAGHTRKLAIRVGEIEKTVNNNSKKITSLKNISKTQSGRISGTNIGAKLPGSSASNVEESISAIAKSVSSIADIMASRKKLADDTAAYEKRKAEQEKRGLAESKLEKVFRGIAKTAEKIIAPVKSLLDRILDFIGTVILGRIVFKIVEWMGDPKNASKVKSIIRFVKDWWPALIGSYILFGTTFGRFIRGMTGMLGRFIFQVGKVAIPQLLRLIRTPFGAGALLFGAGAAIPAMLPGTVDGQERKTKATPGTTEEKIRSLEQQKANLNFLQRMQGVGSEIDEQIYSLKTGKTKAYSSGGFVNGFVSGERGVDKIPAMLSDGEFVMSRGAVAKYGVDTLEAMNAAGGGTNKPKVVSGVPHAYGGGLFGKDPGEGGIKTNTPFIKDPFNAISRFIKFKFGADVGKQSTWGAPTATQRGSQSRVSSGSLMTDPVGAVARIANNMGIRTPDVATSTQSKQPSSTSGNIFTRVMNAVRNKTPGSEKSKIKTGEKGFLQEIQEKLTGSGAATYRNAGNIYAKQMLGGFGGPISERDLAPESQAELQNAIKRAKKRTGSEIAKAEAKIKELRSMGAKDGNPALETQKSFLKKLKSGGIRVQYADYADEKGNMSESAKNAKNILGQFWANQRSKEEGGGYRIEDKYDFDKMKDPMGVLFGKGKSVQQRLQALHQLNPLKGKGDVDMVLGGKRTAAESLGLSGSKTLLGGMLGVSGKPKDKNTQALESKRPWWDKAGWFGGGSRVSQEQAKKAQIAKSKPTAKPIKPPTKPQAKVTVVKPKSNQYKGGQRSGKAKTPNFGATCPASGNAKAKTLGVRK